MLCRYPELCSLCLAAPVFPAPIPPLRVRFLPVSSLLHPQPLAFKHPLSAREPAALGGGEQLSLRLCCPFLSLSCRQVTVPQVFIFTLPETQAVAPSPWPAASTEPPPRPAVRVSGVASAVLARQGPLTTEPSSGPLVTDVRPTSPSRACCISCRKRLSAACLRPVTQGRDEPGPLLTTRSRAVTWRTGPAGAMKATGSRASGKTGRDRGSPWRAEPPLSLPVGPAMARR